MREDGCIQYESAKQIVPQQILDELAKESAMREVNPAQDFVGGKFYYGCIIGNKKYLVSSDRSIVPIGELQSSGLKLAASDFSKSRFSGQGIKSFLQGETVPPASEIHNRLVSYLKRFVVLNKESQYDFLALWVMGTYVFRAFRYFPYLHITGEKGSGKSALSEVISPFCFNSLTTVSVTPAVIFREIQNNSSTLLIDEVENLGGEDREKRSDVMSVLNQGFSKIGQVSRCVGDNHEKIGTFSAYSPKALIGIKELDNVLRDRAIRIRMLRKSRDEVVEHDTQSEAVVNVQETLRDDLYVFGLTRGPKIADLYREHFMDIRGLENLANREADLWAPIMAIANLVETKASPVTQLMRELSAQCKTERAEDDQEDNETTMLLSALHRLIDEGTPAGGAVDHPIFDSDIAYTFFMRQDGFERSLTKTRLTQMVKRIGVKVKNVKVCGKTKRCYEVSRATLQDLLKRYPVDTQSVTVTKSITGQTAVSS